MSRTPADGHIIGIDLAKNQDDDEIDGEGKMSNVINLAERRRDKPVREAPPTTWLDTALLLNPFAMMAMEIMKARKKAEIVNWPFHKVK